jgi:hypothetical protein
MACWLPLGCSSMPWAQLKSAAASRQALPSARPDGGASCVDHPRIHAVHLDMCAWCTALGDASYLKTVVGAHINSAGL